MESLTTSAILLIIALTLLWLGATDKLSRTIDAWDVITGKETASSSNNKSGVAALTLPNIQLPGLPPLSINPQVIA